MNAAVMATKGFQPVAARPAVLEGWSLAFRGDEGLAVLEPADGAFNNNNNKNNENKNNENNNGSATRDAVASGVPGFLFLMPHDMMTKLEALEAGCTKLQGFALCQKAEQEKRGQTVKPNTNVSGAAAAAAAAAAAQQVQSDFDAAGGGERPESVQCFFFRPPPHNNTAHNGDAPPTERYVDVMLEALQDACVSDITTSSSSNKMQQFPSSSSSSGGADHMLLAPGSDFEKRFRSHFQWLQGHRKVLRPPLDGSYPERPSSSSSSSSSGDCSGEDKLPGDKQEEKQEQQQQEEQPDLQLLHQPRRVRSADHKHTTFRTPTMTRSQLALHNGHGTTGAGCRLCFAVNRTVMEVVCPVDSPQYSWLRHGLGGRDVTLLTARTRCVLPAALN